MNEIWFWAIWLLGAYLLGSLSPGDIISKVAGVNIRSLGTGNPGTVNIYKELGPGYGSLVFVLDFASGAIVTVPLYLLSPPPWLRVAATGAVLAGHIFPVFWRFRGGAGGALGMGCVVGLLPFGALIGGAVTAAHFAIARTPIYSVWLYFAAVLLAGGLIHRDVWGVAGTLLAMLAPTMRFFVQQHIRSIADLRRALGI